jgi:putative membrane protein
MEGAMAMMFWYDHGMNGWGWAGMVIGMVLFWAVVIGAGVLLFRAFARGTGQSTTPPAGGPTPEQLLAERYARGEIDDEEYQQRLATLRRSATDKLNEALSRPGPGNADPAHRHPHPGP